jgi:SAM-dependent methyltransferase
MEEAPRSADQIRDLNARYHDAAAAGYDSKWAIDFGEIGQGQVLGKLRKLIGSELDGGYQRTLEIGAGTGYFTLNLLRAGKVQDATCSDISPGMVAALQRNAQQLGVEVKTACADAEALPFGPASFDVVLGHAVLHHLPDLERAFAEFHRVLKPGGRIAFAGEPSQLGDRLAAIPKRSAVAVAPLWRAIMGAGPAVAPAVATADGASVEKHHSGTDHDPEPHDGAEHDPEPHDGGEHDPEPHDGGEHDPEPQDGGEHDPVHHSDSDHDLERFVDIHAFAPSELVRLAEGAGFRDVRVCGEELIANWFGWFNRALEATADPDGVPVSWRRYAFNGYLLLQRIDARLLEPRLPPAIFYNLMLTGRKPDS